MKAIADKPTRKKVSAIDMNPMLIEALGTITQQNMPWFLMANPVLVPEQIKKQATKTSQNFLNKVIFCLLTGVCINIGAKKVQPRILSLHMAFRYPLRLFLFTVPFACFYYSWSNDLEKLYSIHQKMYRKISNLKQNGDIEGYFAEE